MSATTGYSGILERFASENRLRKIPRHRSGEGLIDLCSNDYMGISRRAGEWKEEFGELLRNAAMTSSASRLLAADQEEYILLEKLTGSLYGREAILFNSGYHANVGLVSSLNIEGTLWLTDKLIHASAIDGLRQSGAEFLRWNHNDTAHLRKIIDRTEGLYDRRIILFETIYSMDGDIAPLLELAEIKKEHDDIMLYADEAHAFGVHGPHGAGMAAEAGVADEIDIIVGTLGKACGSTGAFAICSEMMREYIVNTARSLIFSTAIAPVNALWSRLMIEKLMDMDDERRHLAKISTRFRLGLEEITGKRIPSDSAIVPLVTGDAAKACRISERLERNGILALPIRRPTVPPGEERIRFSLNALLTDNDIDRILELTADAYEN